MDRKIHDVDFVVFDVETTGLSPQAGDRIVEIAAVRYKGRRRLGSFSSLLNPQREISPAAFTVNHISQDMLDSAPLASKVLPEFLEFAADACLAGYNVGFDLRFLENELKIIGRPVARNNHVIDVLSMSRRLLPGISSYRLASVVSYLRIDTPQEHRALSDAKLTCSIFESLLDVLKNKGIDGYPQFYCLFGFSPGVTEDSDSQRIASIQRAIDSGVKLKLRYFSGSSGEVTEREVEPKEIRQERGFKYLVGYCHLRKDERTFRIKSILNLEAV